MTRRSTPPTCSACCWRSRTPVRSRRRPKRRAVLPLCLGPAARGRGAVRRAAARDRARTRHPPDAARAKAGLGRPPHRRAPVADAAQPGLGTRSRTGQGAHARRQAAHLRMDASHGFAVAALTGYIDRDELPLELRYRTSTDAVAALARRECDLAGFHVPVGASRRDGAPGTCAGSTRTGTAWSTSGGRQQGLMVARGNPLGMQRPGRPGAPEVRFVNRQAGSGTRMLLEMMLASATASAAGRDQRLQQRRVHAFGGGRLHRQRHGRRRHRHARRGRPVQARFHSAGARTLFFRPAQRRPRRASLMRQLLELLRQPGYHRWSTPCPATTPRSRKPSAPERPA
jgi:hypothetical protein